MILGLKMSHYDILSTKVSDVIRMTKLSRLISYIATSGKVMLRGHMVMLRRCNAGG